MPRSSRARRRECSKYTFSLELGRWHCVIVVLGAVRRPLFYCRSIGLVYASIWHNYLLGATLGAVGRRDYSARRGLICQAADRLAGAEIGRASCRERVWVAVDAGSVGER